MKKNILIIMMIGLIATFSGGCQTKEVTRKVVFETPTYYSNMPVRDLSEVDYVLPIKNFKVLESSGVELSLEKNLPAEIKKSDSFKYTDLSKYGYFKMNFRGNDRFEQVGGNQIIKNYAKIELELYSDEIKDLKTGKITATKNKFIYQDGYNGYTEYSYIPNPKIAKNFDEQFGNYYNQLKFKSFTEFVQTPEFKAIKAKTDKELGAKIDLTDKINAIRKITNQEVKYDPTSLSAASALTALKTKKGVCYDFAFLMDSLCKIYKLDSAIVLGIYVDGENQIINHAWIVLNDKMVQSGKDIDVTYLIDQSELTFTSTSKDFEDPNYAKISGHYRIWDSKINKFNKFSVEW